jgi:AGCS family alanine or glycine:cation symporter
MPDMLASLEALFAQLVAFFEAILFYPVPLPYFEEGFPFLVLWLLVAGVFFTFRFGFQNFRLIGHGLNVVRGKYKHEEGEGEISSFQAVATVVSGTVGVGGNIAGVAIAVSVGGPGAVIWIMLAGLFCTANKFVEVIVGHHYRHKDAQGRFSGGAWYYLTEGLHDAGYGWLGKPLALVFAFFCVGGAMGGGNMFQSNQAVAIMRDTYPVLAGFDWSLALLMAVLIGVVLIGGIKRIAHVTQVLVPAMALIYVVAGLFIVGWHIEAVPQAFGLMLHHAFTLEAAGGGMIGAILIGLRRAFFSNEAGVGSAPIVHATTRNVHPVREGAAALIEPIIDSVLICGMTGLIIVVTGAYLNVDGMTGVSLTSAAFASVIPWFPHVLTLCVLMFAFSTALTWSYYGERAWHYLTGGRFTILYYLIFCTLTFFGGIMTQLGPIVMLSDLLLLSMAVPNLLGLFLMSGLIARLVKEYRAGMQQV